MKIVIVGGGKVGYAIAGEVSGEGHDVTIIDHNPANYERLSTGLDCMTILGDGNSLEALRAANAGESDLLIAATPNDEVNILCCFLARKLGCPNTIARLRRWEYKQEMDLLQEDLGLSMMVTPDSAAAQEVFRLLQFQVFSNASLLQRTAWKWLPLRSNRKVCSTAKSLWNCSEC